MAQYGLLRATCALACDNKLYQLVCNINIALDYVMKGTVNDPIGNFSLKLFADADFAAKARLAAQVGCSYASSGRTPSCHWRPFQRIALALE